jgi:hypothetical protein
VNIGLFQQFTPNSFASATFEQDIVRYNDCSTSVLLENRENMLKEVKLLVACGRPEIVAVNYQ